MRIPSASVDLRDLIFRVLFSSIFLGLGFEHLFSSALILTLMPAWLPYPHELSLLAGIILLTGGLSIFLGYKIRMGARLLGAFLLLVSLCIHLPGSLAVPPSIEPETAWLWTLYQRSNFVKNLCLFGVCVHLTTHEAKRYSLDAWLRR